MEDVAQRKISQVLNWKTTSPVSAEKKVMNQHLKQEIASALSSKTTMFEDKRAAPKLETDMADLSVA